MDEDKKQHGSQVIEQPGSLITVAKSRPQAKLTWEGSYSGCCWWQVNDGTTLAGLQVVVQPEVPGYGLLEDGTVNTGAAVRVQGDLVESPGKGQKVSESWRHCVMIQCM